LDRNTKGVTDGESEDMNCYVVIRARWGEPVGQSADKVDKMKEKVDFTGKMTHIRCLQFVIYANNLSR